MPVDFQFERLTIDSFRGIRKADLTFEIGTPTYLIGGNNSGKSTVLEAIAYVLRGGGFHSYDVNEFDFHRTKDGSTCDDFNLSIRFDAASPELLPAVQGAGNPIAVHGIALLGRRKKKQLEHRRVLVDERGKPITYSPRTPLKGAAKETYSDHNLGWTPYYARIEDIRDFMPDVWLLKADNLERSLYHWQTGPLQKLATILSEKFLDTKWQFVYQGTAREMPSTMERAHAFFHDATASFPFWKEDLKPKLEKALSNYLGRSTSIGLKPDIQSFREWLAQQLAVSFAAEEGGPLTPLQAMGDGWQALVRLAALEVLQGFADPKQTPVFILFEEPETYLHPHLRRKLRNVLARLAKKGWMVVCTTHSPEFITFAGEQQVVRLWRGETERSPCTLLSTSIPEGPRFQEKLDERGQHEFLFANRVVLCEGKNDSFAARIYMDKAQVDLDGRGVSFLDIGGVGGMPAYAEIAKALGIPWCAITDEDMQGDGTQKAKTEEARTVLAALKTDADQMLLWPGDLERSLGIDSGKATPLWQQTHLVPKTLPELQSAYAGYCEVGNRLREWIEG